MQAIIQHFCIFHPQSHPVLYLSNIYLSILLYTNSFFVPSIIMHCIPSMISHNNMDFTPNQIFVDGHGKTAFIFVVRCKKYIKSRLLRSVE